MSSLITLTTDFGCDSPYVAAMKGVILSINPAATIVDVAHGIAPQNIAEGAFVWGETTRWFPPGSIHVAVVDPGVGTERRIVYARVAGQQYVCPDNGLLSFLCRDQPPELLVAVTNRSLFLAEVSNTFHGRDIMAPVTAQLSLGLPAHELGPAIDDLKLFDWPRPERLSHAVKGRILYADSFGNLITNIHATICQARLSPPPFSSKRHDTSSRRLSKLIQTLGPARRLRCSVRADYWNSPSSRGMPLPSCRFQLARVSTCGGGGRHAHGT